MFNNLRFSWVTTFAFLLLVLSLATWGLGCGGSGGLWDECIEDSDCDCKYSCISSFCENEPQTSWECTCGKPPVLIGENCSKGCQCTYECKKGVCTAGLEEGEACETTSECKNSHGEWAMHPDGEPGMFGPELHCVKSENNAKHMTCSPSLADGEARAIGSGDCQNQCIQSENNSKHETCSTPLMPGEPCAASQGGVTDCLTQCDNLVCRFFSDGEACTQKEQCEPELHCIESTTNKKYQTCSPKLADDEKCEPDKDDCQNYCNALDQVCCNFDVPNGGCDSCGDGTCEAGEICACEADCGAPCGNGTCDCGETVGGCPEDCR